MLTRLKIRNFKRFGYVEVDLGNPVVFIGPNNSGKTTALQALALWDIGLKRWNEKRSGKEAPKKRPGVTINRRDLVSVPVPDANLLWHNLHVRDVRKIEGKQRTQNIRVEIVVEGVSGGRAWTCGFEFDYANEESFYCRPLRPAEGNDPPLLAIPPEASDMKVAFLPPMSGLAANESRLDPGAINVRIGEGRTAEVLRNLCYQIAEQPPGLERWKGVCEKIGSLFGVDLDPPKYIPERGEIVMSYRDPSGVRLDLSSAGRGLQQTLLILAHLTVNPNSVLLIDEPDAHLEILRQREIYQILADTARGEGSQVIVASHSEVVLNEAAGRDTVVAFLGKTPHRIDDRGSQLLKSLRDIPFDHYYQAEQAGWVLYLEGSSDLAILREFARLLGHPGEKALDRPFVRYVVNQPNKAHEHFYGLREAKPDLLGFALFDKLDSEPHGRPGLDQRMWRKREIENYFCKKDTLLAWARATDETKEGGPLLAKGWSKVMEESMVDVEKAMSVLGKGSPWSGDTKVSDEFLAPLFEAFYKKLGLPNLMAKTNYYLLVSHMKAADLDAEVREVLDRIHETAGKARVGSEG